MIKPVRLGHLVLRVRNVIRSEKFYRNILGLEVRNRLENGMVFFRSNEEIDHDLAIMQVGDDAPGPSSAAVGLYHFAYELSSFKELEEAYQIIQENGVLIAGFGDHGDTKSLYILDPDGNEVELYALAPGQEEIALKDLFSNIQTKTVES